MIHYEYIGERGKALAEKISGALPPYDRDGVVFIGALGICVRKLQTLIRDKYTDPAVVCVDTTGRWVIPVLSGHVGGANDLARRIAQITGGQAVVTTQSDSAGLWPLDTLAQEFGWGMVPVERAEMNGNIAKFVSGRPTALLLEWDDRDTRQLLHTCPEHVTVFRSYDDYRQSQTDFELTIAVSYRLRTEADIQYIPRCLRLGFGCQKQLPLAAAGELLAKLEEQGISPEAVNSINTIELKRDEPVLAALGKRMPQAQVHIYPAEVLDAVAVPNASEKVAGVTGSGSVAEASAMADGQRLIVEKQKGAVDGRYYTYAVAEQKQHGHIEIVGAGPGDPDLVSVRGRKFLEKADLILYAGSLVPKALTECAKPGATVRSSADMTLHEQQNLMKTYYDRGCLVVRLHTGDPCIYGAISEQMAFFDSHGMSYHITPGISSFLAAAAELRSQFTIPEQCQTIILTRGSGRTAVPDRERLHLLAAHQSTMCIFLSATLAREVQTELLAGGYPPETPVAVCHKLTWPQQRILRGQLKDLARIVEENDLSLTTMIVVGEAIDNRQGESRLYDKNFAHLFRPSQS